VDPEADDHGIEKWEHLKLPVLELWPPVVQPITITITHNHTHWCEVVVAMVVLKELSVLRLHVPTYTEKLKPGSEFQKHCRPELHNKSLSCNHLDGIRTFKEMKIFGTEPRTSRQNTF
jgi:hypothetical protein